MLAERCRQIRPFYVMDLLAQAKALELQGRDIIHMEVGEPDFATPQPIVAAGVRALHAGKTHYTPTLGLPELRTAIADDYQQRYAVQVDPRRIIVTPGSSSALQLLMHALINPGDAVLLTDPGYPCNKNFVVLVGGVPILLPLSAQTGFQLTVEQVARAWTPRSKVLMLASPANPTGAITPTAQLRAILDWVQGQGGQLIVDEIYHGLHYTEAIDSALSLSDQVYVVNSFSKYFSMTGWRLGWLVVPEQEVEYFDRLAQNLFLAAPTVAQYAALAAFGPETIAILDNRRTQFRARRDFLLRELRALGFDIPITPQGAFYLYANAAAFTTDSFAWCANVLNDVGVAITPGRDFAKRDAEQFVRFAYTTDIERIGEGVRRLHNWVEQHG